MGVGDPPPFGCDRGGEKRSYLHPGEGFGSSSFERTRERERAVGKQKISCELSAELRQDPLLESHR